MSCIPLANITGPGEVDGSAALCDAKTLLAGDAHGGHMNAVAARHGEENI
jgi:hypothetical protein